MKIKWVLIVVASLFVSIISTEAGLFGNIANGLNNSADKKDDEANNQPSVLPQTPDAVKPADGNPYYTKSSSGEQIPFPFERVFSDAMSGYYKVSGAWYFFAMTISLIS